MRGLLIRTVNELKEFAQVQGNMAVKWYGKQFYQKNEKSL